MGKLAAFVTNKQSFDAVNAVQKDAAVKGNITNAQEKYASDKSPDFLIVELTSKSHEEAFAELDKLAGVCHKDTQVIVTGDIDELSFYKKLISMGVFEYILNPVTSAQLEKLVSEKTAGEESAKGSELRKDSKIIAVVGTRGGVGASSIALNLASYYAAKKYPTAILDFDPEFGTIPLMLDVEPSRGLVDALEKPERVDTLFMDRAMTKVNEHLYALGAERSIGEVGKIDDKAAEVLLSQLKSKFSYIIVDISQVQEYEYYVLKHAECIVVTELSIPGLRDTMRVYDLIKDTLGNKRITIVANKTGVNKRFETPLKDFEHGLGKKIDVTIPFEQEAYGYFENGKTMVTAHKDNKFSKAVISLAERFLSNATATNAAPAEQKRSGGLLDAFKKKK